MPTIQNHSGQWYDSASGQWVPTPLPLDQMFLSGTDFGENLISSFSSFSAAITALAPLGKQRLRIASLQTLTADVDVPGNIVLVLVGAGGFTSSTAINLTIRGGLVADANQIFFNNLVVKFVHADNSINPQLQWVLAEWWGAVGNDSTDDTAAFNKAFAAMANSMGIGLRLLARPYRACAVIPPPLFNGIGITIIGSGTASTIRSNSASLPALSIDLGPSDRNTTLILRDFGVVARTTNHTAPPLSLKASGGTGSRLFGVIDNVAAVADGTYADAIYIKGALALTMNVRTESGRYALYHEDSSNSMITIHAGNATCSGVMVKGGGNNSILRARIEDSSSANIRPVASITGNGSTVTVVMQAAHNAEDMDRITITGASGFNFTAPRRITVVNPTTFTYPGTETGSVSAGSVRFSSFVLRLKDTGGNEIYAVANEGKDGIDYCLWLQSTGTQGTGEPSCSHNVFFGGGYGEPNSTARDQLATLIMEGPCMANRGMGITLGKASGVKAGYFDVLLLQNDSGVKPVGNRFIGNISRGTGNTGTMVYSQPSNNPGHYFELYDKVSQRVYVNGDKRELSGDSGISEIDQIITTRAAVGIITLTCFASYAMQKPITITNNNETYAVRVKPASGEKWAGHAANKYLEIPAGGSLVFNCSNAGVLDVAASSGALTFEP